MRETVSAIDLYFMSKEFQDLVGARIDKVYHRRDELALQLFSSKTKKVFLFFKLPSTIFLTDKKPDTDEVAGGFCMFLRKKLNMGRIESISLMGFERVLKIVVDNKGEKFDFIIELINPGNFLLVQNDKILSMQNTRNTQSRVVRGGIEYKPLVREYDALEMDENQLIEVFANTDKESLIKTLAVDLGFGGVYSEEICLIAKIDKDSKDLSVDDIKKIHKAINKLKNSNIKPVKIDNEIYPFQLNVTKKGEFLENSFCKEIGNILIDNFIDKKIELEKTTQNKSLKKIEGIVEKQKKQIESLEKESLESLKKGEGIYENYSKIEELLKIINDAKNKYSYKEIKEKLIEKDLINDLNEKEQSIIVRL